jgi:hypothetical protein
MQPFQPSQYGQPFDQQGQLQHGHQSLMYAQQPLVFGSQPAFYGPQHLVTGQQQPMHGPHPVPSTPEQVQPLIWGLNNQLDTMMMQEKMQQEYRQKIQDKEKECKATIESERDYTSRMTALRELKLMTSPPGTFPSTPGSGGHRQP